MRLRRIAQSVVQQIASSSRSSTGGGVSSTSSSSVSGSSDGGSAWWRAAALVGGRDATTSSSSATAAGGLLLRHAAAAPPFLHRHATATALLYHTTASPASLWPRQQQHLLLLAGRHAAPPHSLAAAAAAAAAASAGAQCRRQHSGRGSRRSIADNGLYLGAVALGMLALSYLSVPLYRMFCQATGYGGALGREAAGVEEKLRKRREAPDAELEAKAAARELRVWFSADVADGVPWRFTPTQEFVRVRPGESTLAFFTAENLSDKPVTGVSTYNVVPEKAALYFNKVQCFCFEEQRLRPHEAVDMPVFFYIDPELAGDFNCRNIHDITLSYTFYRVDDDEDGDEGDGEGGGSSGGPRVHTWTSGPLPANIKVPEGLALPPGVTREGEGDGGGKSDSSSSSSIGGESGGGSKGKETP